MYVLAALWTGFKCYSWSLRKSLWSPSECATRELIWNLRRACQWSSVLRPLAVLVLVGSTLRVASHFTDCCGEPLSPAHPFPGPPTLAVRKGCHPASHEPPGYCWGFVLLATPGGLPWLDKVGAPWAFSHVKGFSRLGYPGVKKGTHHRVLSHTSTCLASLAFFPPSFQFCDICFLHIMQSF